VARRQGVNLQENVQIKTKQHKLVEYLSLRNDTVQVKYWHYTTGYCYINND